MASRRERRQQGPVASRELEGRDAFRQRGDGPDGKIQIRCVCHGPPILLLGCYNNI